MERTIRSTDVGLLEKVRRDDAEAWREMLRLYAPLVLSWLKQAPLPEESVLSLSQDVLSAVARGISSFQHNGRAGAFRRWLRKLTADRVREFCLSAVETPESARGLLDELENPHSELNRRWDAEHDRYVQEQLFEIVRSEFDEPTWRVFQGCVQENRRCEELAAELQMTVTDVLIARSRILRCLRERLEQSS